MFARILVPVDGSEGARAALKMAIQLQKKYDSELLILCVYRHYSLLEASLSMVRPANVGNLDDSMREYASSIVDDAKRYALAMGTDKVRAFVKNGPPARTIVKFAEEREADLIVLGSRGVGDVEGYLLGSVSHKVTGMAKCPVLVV